MQQSFNTPPRTVLFLLLLFVNHYVFAQQGFCLGLKGGVNIPDLKSSGDNPVSSGWSSRLAPCAGIFAAYRFNKIFSLQAELNYSGQGGKKKGVQALSGNDFSELFPPGTEPPPYVYASYRDESKLDYIELPVLLKATFPLNHTFQLFAYGGLYGGYLTEAKNVTHGSSNIYSDEKLTQPLLPTAISFDQVDDVRDDLKKMNAGIQGGGGIGWKLSKRGRLVLTGGGSYGLIHIEKDETNGKNRTGAATVSFGYLVCFGALD